MNSLSRSEMLILAALGAREQYGLGILETMKKITGQSISLGGLYTTLHRMERKGLVTARWGESTELRQGARRRYYKITARGERALADTKRVFMKAWRATPAMVGLAPEKG